MTERPSVLFPIRVLEGESIPEGVPELLANAHVVLLGYHVVPDQTATNQARMQFEERAESRMDTFEEMLVDAGATVDRRLVFTHDAQPTIDRTIYEHGCLAVLVPSATGPPEDVFVPVRGTVGVDRIVPLVAGLFANTNVGITLFHVLEGEESEEDGRTFLRGIADRLVEEGIEEDAVEIDVRSAEKPMGTIQEVASDYDAVVIGETDPTVVTYFFGMRAGEVADQFLEPVFVVQRERPEYDDSAGLDAVGDQE